MSPEQLAGCADARSDIYSLGLTLYEMLTWRPAFPERRRSRLLQDIAAASPPPPSRLDAMIPRDLENIVLKAIARRPADRYQTADQLADDLTRFLEDRPVSVHRSRVSSIVLRRRGDENSSKQRLCLTTLVALVIAALTAFLYLQARVDLRQATDHTQRVVADTGKAKQQARRADKDLQIAFASFDAVADPSVTRPSGGGRRPQEALAAPTSEATIVLQRLLAFFNEFIDRNSASPESLEQLVHAHRSVGRIHVRFGDLHAAESAYDRGLVLCQQEFDLRGNANQLAETRDALLDDLASLRRQIRLATAGLGPTPSANP
jgi:hypothetical protein